MPKAARVRVARPPAGAAPVPQQGSASQATSEPWTRIIAHVTKTGTIVNREVTINFPPPLGIGNFCPAIPLRCLNEAADFLDPPAAFPRGTRRGE
jgi:hypothetical protein